LYLPVERPGLPGAGAGHRDRFDRGSCGRAKITLVNTGTGVETVRQSNANGQYLFDFVDPGAYQLAAELAGFSRFVQQGILVQVRGDVTVDAVLKVGVVAETVNVSDEKNREVLGAGRDAVYQANQGPRVAQF